MAAEIVREYLFEKDSCETKCYDGDEIIMHTDIGYFNDGLIQLIGYLSAKVDELKEKSDE